METELTKNIKRATHFYKPLMNTEMRTIRYADEVWTPSGLVDSIRFEDYKKRDFSYCSKIEMRDCDKNGAYADLLDGKCKIKGNTYPCDDCKGCVFKRNGYEIGMCITCFEVKITLSDFKSNNGHNFHGNRNYYVVPKDLVPKVINLIPQDIGLIQYLDKSKTLRLVKECEFKTIDDEIRWNLLYNAMKKWVDGVQQN